VEGNGGGSEMSEGKLSNVDADADAP